MNRISSNGMAQKSWAFPQPPDRLEADPEPLFPLRASLSAIEVQALRDALDHPCEGDSDGRCEAGDLWLERAAAGGGAALSKIELCLRFVCMTSGGILFAAGLVSSLSLGLFASPLFGFVGLGAAALGGALCAGGVVIGRNRGLEATSGRRAG